MWIKYITYDEKRCPLYKGVDIGLNVMYMDKLYYEDPDSVFEMLERMYNEFIKIRRDEKIKIISK